MNTQVNESYEEKLVLLLIEWSVVEENVARGEGSSSGLHLATSWAWNKGNQQIACSNESGKKIRLKIEARVVE